MRSKSLTEHELFEKYRREIKKCISLDEIKEISGRAYLTLDSQERSKQFREIVVARLQKIRYAKERLDEFAEKNLTQGDLGRAAGRARGLLLAVFLAGMEAAADAPE